MADLNSPITTNDIIQKVNESALPDQTGHTGDFLKSGSDGLEWDSVDALPSQTGQSGKFLTTDGTDLSWNLDLVEKLSTIPVTPDGSDVGRVVMYTGENTASYEHGYVYECKQAEPVYTASITFSPDKYDHDDSVCDLMDFLQMFTPDYLDAASGTIQFHEGNEDEEDWEENEYIFTCKDADNNTLFSEAFAESEFYDSYGFSPRTTLTDGEVVNFTITIEEDDENYYWERIDVQPAPVVSDTLASLTDTSIQDPQDSDILRYNYDDQKWENRPLSSIFGHTIITLDANAWDGNNEQSIYVPEMTGASIVWVSPDLGSTEDYAAAGVQCSGQSIEELTFLCDTVPANNIDVQVVFTKG
jgi:hypothetical protein